MGKHTTNRSDLMHRLVIKHRLHPVEAEHLVKTILETISNALSRQERVELRGFGNFETRYRKSRSARNPKTGEAVKTQGKYTVHFKPGKTLRERVDESKEKD